MTTMSEEVWAAPRHPPRRAPAPPAPAEPPPSSRRLIGAASTGGLLVMAFSAMLWSGPDEVPSDLTIAERTELVAAADLATVRVAARACPGVVSGSGFVVDSVMFTTAHLVTFETAVKVDRPGRPIAAEVLASSAAVDVAVVDAQWLVARPLEVRGTDLPDGSPVVVAGHPDGDDLAIVAGRLRGYAPATDWGVGGDRVMLIDAPVAGGFSGGPILDRTGSAIGMLVGVDTTTGLSVAVPGDELRSVARVANRVWGSGTRLITHAPDSCPGDG